jgi:hypothetical protein
MNGRISAWSEPLTGADQALLASPGTYRGITVRETAGAVATVRLFDHASAASGTLLATISLAANGSFDVLYPDGIRAAKGIYVDVTGAVEGAVRLA